MVNLSVKSIAMILDVYSSSQFAESGFPLQALPEVPKAVQFDWRHLSFPKRNHFLQIAATTQFIRSEPGHIGTRVTRAVSAIQD